MIAIFKGKYETIVVGIKGDGSPIDSRLFSPESGRDINNFERFNVDIDSGQSVHITNEIKVFHPHGGIIMEG